MKHIRFYFALLGIMATIYFGVEYLKLSFTQVVQITSPDK
jgi:hypothetical protein